MEVKFYLIGGFIWNLDRNTGIWNVLYVMASLPPKTSSETSWRSCCPNWDKDGKRLEARGKSLSWNSDVIGPWRNGECFYYQIRRLNPCWGPSLAETPCLSQGGSFSDRIHAVNNETEAETGTAVAKEWRSPNLVHKSTSQPNSGRDTKYIGELK